MNGGICSACAAEDSSNFCSTFVAVPFDVVNEPMDDVLRGMVNRLKVFDMVDETSIVSACVLHGRKDETCMDSGQRSQQGMFTYSHTDLRMKGSREGDYVQFVNTASGWLCPSMVTSN